LIGREEENSCLDQGVQEESLQQTFWNPEEEALCTSSAFSEQ